MSIDHASAVAAPKSARLPTAQSMHDLDRL